jgi:hypothetical protein
VIGVADTNDAELSVNKIDQRERRFAYAGALLGLVMVVGLYAPHLHDKVHRNQADPLTFLVVGVVLSILLAVATAIGRRALVGFLALFIGLSLGFIAGLPFLALGGWLIARAMRISQAQAQAKRAAGGSGGSRADSVKGATGTRRKGREDPATGRGRPEASKRYTPPKPPARRRKRPAADKTA